MARLSLLKLLLALAVLAVALAQRVVTTTTVRAGTTYVEVLSTDVDGSIETETLSVIAATTAPTTSTALTSALTTTAPLTTTTTTSDTEDVLTSTTSTGLLTTTTSARTTTTTTTSTDDEETTSTSTTTRRPPPVGPTNGVDVPAGTIMDVGEYSSLVGERYSSRLAEYTATGGAAPTWVNNPSNSTGSHNEVSAMFVAAGLVAAAFL